MFDEMRKVADAVRGFLYFHLDEIEPIEPLEPLPSPQEHPLR